MDDIEVLPPPEREDFVVRTSAEPYDPRPGRDRTRDRLAHNTLALLAAVVLLTLTTAAVFPRAWETYERALTIVFTPIVGFAGLTFAHFFDHHGRGGTR